MSKTLDRISALLAKAESTDNEAERDAYMSKAQTLATLASIELEVARQHQADKTRREVPTSKAIRLFTWQDGSARSKSKAAFIRLFLAVGAQNYLMTDIYHDNNGVVTYGMPSDIEVTEALYASLAVQMKAAADAFLKTGEYKKEIVTYERRVGSRWYGYDIEYVERPMDGRTARANFYNGFISAVGDRLRKARLEAEQQEVTLPAASEGTSEAPTESTTSTGALVLVGKREEVSAAYEKGSRARGSWRGGGSSHHSQSSRAAGSKAGQSARLSGSKGSLGSKGVLGA